MLSPSLRSVRRSWLCWCVREDAVELEGLFLQLVIEEEEELEALPIVEGTSWVDYTHEAATLEALNKESKKERENGRRGLKKTFSAAAPPSIGHSPLFLPPMQLVDLKCCHGSRQQHV